MTTPAQVAANQRNAQQSTGPKTTAGKARTSKNATTHGVLAEDVILTGENAQLFEERRDAIFADLSPSGELEQVLVERIVVCEWRLRRLRQIETSVFQYEVFDHEVRRAYDLAEQCTRPDYGDLSLMDRIVTDEKRRATALHQAEQAKAARENETLAIAFTKATTTTDTLTKLSRYEVAIERSMYRALHELQRLQAARQGRDVAPPAVLDVEVSTSPSGSG